MKIGFTGTREGMTELQFDAFCLVLAKLLRDSREFHHGDCVGSDAEAHEAAALVAKWTIVIHPPLNPRHQAHCGDLPLRFAAVRSLPRRDYLERNVDIVDDTDILIATPAQENEQRRSGTWSTIRYAEKLKRPITIIYPDGRISNHPQ